MGNTANENVIQKPVCWIPDDALRMIQDPQRIRVLGVPLITYDGENTTPLYLNPPEKTWIDPNDKAQKQYLPHIGEQVLFCHKEKIYIGKHTGGSFKAMTPPFAHFGTWDCHWMYPPAAKGKQ